MKTSKRKRSAKAAPAVEAPVVDVVAETPAVVEQSAETMVDTSAELSATAVQALVAEPIAEAVVGAVVEPVAEPVMEAAIESAACVMEAPVEPVIEAAAEPVMEAAVEPVAEVAVEAGAATEETIVAEVAAEPPPAAEPMQAAPLQAAPLQAAPLQAAPLVVLNANCSVKDAAALKTSLLAFVKHSDAVTLDVSAVERVDTATMQLLCAFVRDRSGRNQSVTWRGESQALNDAVRLLGVAALIGFEPKGVAA